MSNRYAADGVEASYQPGSRRRVLANLRGIVRVAEMQQVESDALLRLFGELLEEVSDNQGFNADDLRGWHARWLGGIYPWAGKYRSVNMGKGGFQFASAPQVPKLMAEYQREILAAHTPCKGMDEQQLAQALAITHAEFILIHPFREGNGRLARLLNTLMALQAGFPALDYGSIKGRKKREYIAAIHAALGRNYAPLEVVFRAVLNRTLREDEA